MIRFKITSSNNKYNVNVEGHANYDEKGYDIVCAAASTALNVIINVIDNLGYNIEDYQGSDGKVSFSCIKDDKTSAIIKTLEESFDVLAKDYPLYVKIIK